MVALFLPALSRLAATQATAPPGTFFYFLGWRLSTAIATAQFRTSPAKRRGAPYLHLTGRAGGVEHPWANVLILPNQTSDDLALQSQMSYPRRLAHEKGRIVVEKKKEMMEKRGLQSPAHAEGWC
jgi:hypothetical protein